MKASLSRLVLLGTLSIAAPALAQSPQPTTSEFKPALGKLIRANCHMDSCTWISLQAVHLVGKSPKGELYAVAEKMWSSMHKGGNYETPARRTDEHVYVNFMLCSKTNPAIIDVDSDAPAKGWSKADLKPGRSDTVFGYNITAYVEYMAVCHNNANPDLATQENFGKRLGYRFANGDLSDEKIASPFDVLR